MKTKTSFRDLYSFPGFRARARFKCGVKGDQAARVVELVRRQKKASVPVATVRSMVSGLVVFTASEMWMPQVLESIWISNTGVSAVQMAA
jgi:hypothetical protein